MKLTEREGAMHSFIIHDPQSVEVEERAITTRAPSFSRLLPQGRYGERLSTAPKDIWIPIEGRKEGRPETVRSSLP